MVVRFFPSEEERNERSRSAQRAGRAVTPGAGPAARSGGSAAPEGDEPPETGDAAAARSAATRLAPVAYLPGADPGDRVRAAADAVARIAEEDAAAAEPESDRPAGERKAEQKAQRRAANVSLHQLARRGMSRWELERVLEKREVEAEAAQAELDRLESVGLLDDAALAVSVVYTEHTRKGLGRQAIAHELRRRHIAQELIDEALGEIEDDDEQERAFELARKRVGQLSAYDDETVRRRLAGFLARKGYASELVRAAVADALRHR